MSVPLPLNGYLILLVEDDPLIALDTAQTLQEAGARVFGPFTTAHAAVAAIDNLMGSATLNGAVLDIDLGDHTSEAVASRLQGSSVPFIFHTGNIRIGDRLTEYDAPLVSKPAAPSHLVARLAECIRETKPY